MGHASDFLIRSAVNLAAGLWYQHSRITFEIFDNVSDASHLFGMLGLILSMQITWEWKKKTKQKQIEFVSHRLKLKMSATWHSPFAFHQSLDLVVQHRNKVIDIHHKFHQHYNALQFPIKLIRMHKHRLVWTNQNDSCSLIHQLPEWLKTTILIDQNINEITIKNVSSIK